MLLYVKPTLTGDEPIDVINYHLANRDFPHEDTIDQWFSESQFESYRKLGFHKMEKLVAAGREKIPADKPLTLPNLMEALSSASHHSQTGKASPRST